MSENNTHLACYNFNTHKPILTFFSRNVAKKVCNQRYFVFPPHLTSASALPVETGNQKIASLHLNAVCCFANKHTNDCMHQTKPRQGGSMSC